MKQNPGREQISFHVASLGHHDSAPRSDLCYRLQHGVIKLRRQNRRNRIEKKNKNQDGIQITLKEELKSVILKNQRDGYPKGGRSILKWTQYHCVNIIYLLQCKYSLFRLPQAQRVYVGYSPRVYMSSTLVATPFSCILGSEA